ncbi:MAG TPA: hypothetical protein VFY73_28725 [Ideonella sp.]|uniref:hypothetical protein n=1 Tax=Ideonella sp. TaxID=1929293 RepID=UPI002E318CE3|nr:hypothetical protein [Ideonella sp.]HEX5688021.1 hypothetical protein [Ideonella sp.]
MNPAAPFRSLPPEGAHAADRPSRIRTSDSTRAGDAARGQAVRLHIERLSVAGIAMTPAQSRQFSHALTAELQRLARDPGWPAGVTSVALPAALAPAIATSPADSPAALGRGVAQSVFCTLRGLR